MKKILFIIVVLILLLTGCKDELIYGEVTDKWYEDSSMVPIIYTINGIAHTNWVIVPERWYIIVDDHQVEVAEEVYNEIEVGDYYDERKEP